MATSAEAANHEAAAAAPETPVAPPVTAEETDAAAPANGDAAPAGGDDSAPKKRGRKRKVSATEDKMPGSTEGEAAAGAVADDAATTTETAASAEGVVAAEKSPKEKKSPVAKKPKAAAKAAAAAGPATPTKRKVGRPRKIVKEESESEDETETELRRRVEALPEDIKAQYGSIVWVKMVGFPYWPALITDPRRLHPKYHVGALKEIETKHFVCFYQSNDFSPALYKNIEMWDDSKHDYRKGHPAKDAKAPKRRIHLMEAIAQADKDAPLPIEERMNGLLKEDVEEVESAPEAEEKPVVKRKMGRPLGSKNKPKVVSDDATAAEVAPAAPKAKRGRKKSVEVEEEDTEKVTTTPEEEDTAPPLSKDEIKAKVASRKTPSKKKTASAEEKSAAAAAKKVAKATAKSEPAAKGGELDSKRKKEIELVVPRKSVKSADIREATEEAARKKPGPREKPKDKGEYKVGNLTQFAGKMNRLFANESSKNNDELILLLTQLFEEKMVYRSDVERSGVAAVIAALRKSTNPTVATTASAVRKHLMRVLNDDVTEEVNKKHKADDAGEAKSAKKQKTSPASSEVAAAPAASSESQLNGSSDSPKAVVEKEPEQVKEDVKAEVVVADEPSPSPSPAPVDENKPSVKQEPVASAAPSVAPANDVTKPEPVKPSSPVKAEPMVHIATTPKPDPSGDKARMNCIEMLKKSLAPIGERSAELAREIESQLFERFSESTQDYQTCARTITFGLKKHNHVLERLKNGSLHALELAYTPEEYFKS